MKKTELKVSRDILDVIIEKTERIDQFNPKSRGLESIGYGCYRKRVAGGEY